MVRVWASALVTDSQTPRWNTHARSGCYQLFGKFNVGFRGINVLDYIQKERSCPIIEFFLKTFSILLSKLILFSWLSVFVT